MSDVMMSARESGCCGLKAGFRPSEEPGSTEPMAGEPGSGGRGRKVPHGREEDGGGGSGGEEEEGAEGGKKNSVQRERERELEAQS